MVPSQQGQAEHSSTCAFGTENLERAIEEEALDHTEACHSLSGLLSFTRGHASPWENVLYPEGCLTTPSRKQCSLAYPEVRQGKPLG